MNRIGIIGHQQGFHYRQLKDAFERLGAQVSFFTVKDLPGCIGIGQNKTALFKCDGVVMRGLPGGTLEQIIFRMDALFALEHAGIFFLNSPRSIEKTVDKYYTTFLLESYGLPTPPTITTESAQEAMEAFFRLGEDVVYKPLFGSCGKGMLRLTDADSARAAFEGLERAGAMLYVQKFIPCSNRDIRVFVLGGRVIASMMRTGESWRANFSLGGKVQPYGLSAYEEVLALGAAHAVGADIAGVDLLPADDGSLYVSEVNGSPGWEGLSQVAKADIPLEIAKFTLDKLPGKTYAL
ncbi:MAG: RimK family alpha-L-glutamate ligase [Bacillota bacterium]